MSEPDGLEVAAVGQPAVLLLDPHPAAVRRARAFAQAACRAAGVGAGPADTAVLLTSEVVTNAFLHGRSQARLAVQVGGGVVRVRVSDDNTRWPRVAPAEEGALDGRGMALVDALAAEWGVVDEVVGKTVWFTVAT